MDLTTAINHFHSASRRNQRRIRFFQTALGRWGRAESKDQSAESGRDQIHTQHMKSQTMTASTGVLLLLTVFGDIAFAKHGHQHERLRSVHQKHHIAREANKSRSETGHLTPAEELKKKRGEICVFPDDAGLVAVTPGELNAGWAQSPDMPCEPGKWCPFACPPGQVSMQWNPDVTSYIYPGSMVRQLRVR